MLPLTYMLEVMRDAKADHKRRDAMAMAAAPYLHPKLSSVEANLRNSGGESAPPKTSIVVSFVKPDADHTRDDQE
jgi:hypothetical protein